MKKKAYLLIVAMTILTAICAVVLTNRAELHSSVIQGTSEDTMESIAIDERVDIVENTISAENTSSVEEEIFEDEPVPVTESTHETDAVISEPDFDKAETEGNSTQTESDETGSLSGSGFETGEDEF